MRLLHPKTLSIIAERDDISKAHISRVWSEIFKWKASRQEHPKMFIDDDDDLGLYLDIVYYYGLKKGCNLDIEKVENLSIPTQKEFNSPDDLETIYNLLCDDYFPQDYLFSDACSLYFKGVNIFPDIYGDEWREFVPVESLSEIKRQVDKTLNK